MKHKTKERAKAILSIKKNRPVKKKDNLKLQKYDLNMACLAANLASEKKGDNILLLDVSKLTVVSDYFVVVTAHSTPQVEAIAKHIEENLSKLNYKPISKEGFVASNWVVLDFGNVVVHIMNEHERNYYKLEQFWSNATPIEKKQWKKAS